MAFLEGSWAPGDAHWQGCQGITLFKHQDSAVPPQSLLPAPILVAEDGAQAAGAAG